MLEEQRGFEKKKKPCQRGMADGRKEIGNRSQNHSGMCRLWKTVHKVPRTDGCNPKTKKASGEKSLEKYMKGRHHLKRNHTHRKKL